VRKDVEQYVGQVIAEVPNPQGDVDAMRKAMKQILDRMQSLAGDGTLSFQSPGLSARVMRHDRGLAVSLRDRTLSFVTWNVYAQIISADLVEDEGQVRFLVRAIEPSAPPNRTVPSRLWDDARWQALRADIKLLLTSAAQK
jgi:hypothetical protein